MSASTRFRKKRKKNSRDRTGRRGWGRENATSPELVTYIDCSPSSIVSSISRQTTMEATAFFFVFPSLLQPMLHHHLRRCYVPPHARRRCGCPRADAVRVTIGRGRFPLDLSYLHTYSGREAIARNCIHNK